MLHNVSDLDGRYICLVTETSNVTCILICVYGFNQQKQNEALFNRIEEHVLKLLTKYPNSKLIFGGDFNVALDSSIDRWPPKPPDNSSLYLKMFMQRFSLIDSWRVLHPSQKMFTWSNNSLSSQSRIDMWLISKELCNTSTDILPPPFSDHKSIFIRTHFLAADNVHGFSSYWKLNNSILSYSEVENEINKIIHRNWNKAKEDNSYSSNWEFTKYEISKYLGKFSIDLAKKKKVDEDSIICKITTLLSKNVDELPDCEKAELVELQCKLDNIYSINIKWKGRLLDHAESGLKRVNKILHIFSDWKDSKLKTTKSKN